jgi:hypothetical protein
VQENVPKHPSHNNVDDDAMASGHDYAHDHPFDQDHGGKAVHTTVPTAADPIAYCVEG